MSRLTDRATAAINRRFATLIAACNPLRQLADDWEETMPGKNETAGGHTRGAHADPVAARVLRTPAGHGLAEQCADTANRIDAWIRHGNALARVAERLLPLDSQVAQMLAKHNAVRHVGAGICGRCGRDVPGIKENPLFDIKADRLKAGYCYGQPPECYNAWLAAGRPDRARFVDAWKHESGTDETAGPTPRADDALLSAVLGGPVRPSTETTSGPYCEHVPPNLTDPDAFRCPICNPEQASA